MIQIIDVVPGNLSYKKEPESLDSKQTNKIVTLLVVCSALLTSGVVKAVANEYHMYTIQDVDNLLLKKQLPESVEGELTFQDAGNIIASPLTKNPFAHINQEPDVKHNEEFKSFTSLIQSIGSVLEKPSKIIESFNNSIPKDLQIPKVINNTNQDDELYKPKIYNGVVETHNSISNNNDRRVEPNKNLEKPQKIEKLESKNIDDEPVKLYVGGNIDYIPVTKNPITHSEPGYFGPKNSDLRLIDPN
jgi:hypothetical protein